MCLAYIRVTAEILTLSSQGSRMEGVVKDIALLLTWMEMHLLDL